LGPTQQPDFPEPDPFRMRTVEDSKKKTPMRDPE